MHGPTSSIQNAIVEEKKTSISLQGATGTTEPIEATRRPWAINVNVLLNVKVLIAAKTTRETPSIL